MDTQRSTPELKASDNGTRYFSEPESDEGFVFISGWYRPVKIRRNTTSGHSVGSGYDILQDT